MAKKANYKYVKTKMVGLCSLRRVRKFFPKVETVSDSQKRVLVNVKETDGNGAKPGEFHQCALARACRRELNVDGALIGLAFSYLILGTHATRYSTPEAVSREMISFDRHADFDAGSYSLNAIPKMSQLGTHTDNQRDGKSPNTGNRLSKPYHITARVRRLASGNRWGA